MKIDRRKQLGNNRQYSQADMLRQLSRNNVRGFPKRAFPSQLSWYVLSHALERWTYAKT